MTAEKAGKTCYIIFDKLEVQVTSETWSRAIQIGIKETIANLDKIDNSRFTRIRSIAISRIDVMCAVTICVISEFLGVSISTSVMLKNVNSSLWTFRLRK